MNLPAYQGKPLSALVPAPSIAGQEQLQLWAWLNLWQPIIREQSMDAISDFVAQGMVPSQAIDPGFPVSNRNTPVSNPINQGESQARESATVDPNNSVSNRDIPVPSQAIESAALDSQLYQIARMIVDAEQGIMQTWYKPSQDGVRPVPVILAFTIDPPPPSQLPLGETIDLLNPVPLPQHGEYAIIEHPDGEIFIYHILQLPLEARLHWIKLGNAIRTLSAPLLWHQFDKYYVIAADEPLYQKQLQSISIQHSLAIGTAKEELFMQAWLLKEARIHIAGLHTVLQKPDWLQQWQEIQAMATPVLAIPPGAASL